MLQLIEEGLKKYPNNTVIATDLIQRGYGLSGLDAGTKGRKNQIEN
jgi:hypothetical protein